MGYRVGGGLTTPVRFFDLECTSDGCPCAGRPVRVWLQLVALNVVALPRYVCIRCGCDLYRLPQQEDDMAKITRHGGPTNARAEQPARAVTPADAPAVVEVPVPQADPAAQVDTDGDGAAAVAAAVAAVAEAKPARKTSRGRARTAAASSG